MLNSQQDTRPLAPYRVLDIATGQEGFCARFLGDLGADVIKVEPPSGDPLRAQGPFYGDTPHPDRSLHFWAYNTNKRGVTLNLNSATARDLFLRLVATADVVVESFPPGTLADLELSYPTLAEVRPDLVLTSITPFGQDGPFAHYRAPDLVGQAMGGMMYVMGDQDRRPVRLTFPQAYLHAAAEGVAGTMIALYHKIATGRGQHVDVSMQQAVVWTLMNATVTWDLNQVNAQRSGALRGGVAGPTFRLNWPCKDGYVTFAIGSGATGGPSTQALVRWMAEEGVVPECLTHTDFVETNLRDLTQEEVDLMSEAIQAFFLQHTKGEILEQAVRRRILLYPISDMRDLAHNRQLTERGFYVAVQHPELDETITYLGTAPRFSEPITGIRRRPPLLGEHNEEVFSGELGLTHEEMRLLRATGVM